MYVFVCMYVCIIPTSAQSSMSLLPLPLLLLLQSYGKLSPLIIAEANGKVMSIL
jgi:hypothetical protein